MLTPPTARGQTRRGARMRLAPRSPFTQRPSFPPPLPIERPKPEPPPIERPMLAPPPIERLKFEPPPKPLDMLENEPPPPPPMLRLKLRALTEGAGAAARLGAL